MAKNFLKETAELINNLSRDKKCEFYRYLGEDKAFTYNNKESILISLFMYENRTIDLGNLHLEDYVLFLDCSELKSMSLSASKIKESASMLHSQVGSSVAITGVSCNFLLANNLKMDSAVANGWEAKTSIARNDAICSSLLQGNCVADIIRQEKNVAKDILVQNECRAGNDIYQNSCEAGRNVLMNDCKIGGSLISQNASISDDLVLKQLKLGQAVITDSGMLDGSFKRKGN